MLPQKRKMKMILMMNRIVRLNRMIISWNMMRVKIVAKLKANRIKMIKALKVKNKQILQ